MNELDYKAILKRYINHVYICEGSDFLKKQDIWHKHDDFTLEDMEICNALFENENEVIN